jgi:hypothetical protein
VVGEYRSQFVHGLKLHVGLGVRAGSLGMKEHFECYLVPTMIIFREGPIQFIGTKQTHSC